MKKFMLLHYGFESPTDEIMAAWNDWFKSVGDHIIDHGAHFAKGRELSKSGEKDLPLEADSITGYTIISAENMDEAERLAAQNPFIKAIRIYEMSGGEG